MIGGHDIMIESPPGTPVTEVIVECVRRFWPRAWFQDDETGSYHSVHDPWVMVHGTRSREFFIYREQRAIEPWDREGGTPENNEGLLYFIIGDSPLDSGEPRESTLVCGQLTAELLQFIHSLKRSLQSSWFPARVA